MKRFFILYLLFSVVLKVVGQNTKTVTLRYDESDFCIRENAGILHISCPSHDSSYETDTLAPALPHVYTNVLVGTNVEYKGHSFDATESLLRSDVTIAPYTMPVPTNTFPIKSTSSFPTLDYKKNYPEKNAVEYVGTYMIGGFKYFRFKVYPLKYFFASNSLFIKNVITIKIKITEEKMKTFTKTNFNLRESVRKMVVNQNELDAIYPVTKRLQNKPKTSNAYQYEYLIVTCDSLKDEFQKLADWKTRKGVRTKIIIVEDIYATVPGATPQLKIKKAIKDYFDNSDYTLQYVLLAGDNEIVPTVKSKFTIDIKGKAEYPNVTTDMFYACLGNMDWDSNGNGVVEGEIDDIAYVPEIIVTRLSVNNVSDARSQIERILNYERRPDTKDWENNILVSGVTLDDQLYGEDRLSNTHIKCEQFFYPFYIRDNWPLGIKYMFYDTGTSFEGGRAYQFRTENLQEQLSKGYTFLFLETHGLPDNWQMEYRPEAQPQKQLYYASDALQTSNVGNTIITTSACLTNAFDSIQTSLSEAFMRNPNAGILAYYGSTHYGWWNQSLSIENPTARVVGKFYKNLLTDSRHQMGRAIYASKLEYLSDKWHLTSMNALCDPEMPVFIDIPSEFEDVRISLSNGSLTVATGEQDCRICVSSYADYGNSYYAVTEAVNSQTYNIGNTTCYVCITKPGFIPYVAVVGDDVYIQNETYDNDAEIKARNIFAGNNVTTSKPIGPVIIQSGRVKMNAANSVTLTNGFEVAREAELEITTGD